MKKTKIITLTLLTALTTQVVFAVDAYAATGDVKTITILSTSDLHGRIYPWEYAIDTAQEVGLAKAATLIKQERAIDPDLVLVDTGDSIESNMINLFNEDEIHPMIKGLNLLDYDTWTLGNHEFNFGLDVLNNAIDDFDGSVLSANVVNTADGSYFVDPYTIVESNGLDIALVGITPPYIKQWEASTPDHYEGLDFEDPAAATQKAMDQIKAKEDVDLVIGVFHIGYNGESYDPAVVDNAKEILEQVDGFDAAFLAHSHDVLGTADKQLFVNDTIVLEPGYAGAYVGKLQLDVKEKADGTYEVVNKKSDLLSTKGVTPDPEVLETFKYVDDGSKAAAYEVIGTATADFLPAEEFKGIPVAQVQDSAVIDLINEVQLFYTGADVSGAALFDTRSDIKKGEIQFKDAALIYKYNNTLQSHKITGKNLKAYMEWSANFYNTQVPGDVTVSFNQEIRGYNYDMFAGVEYQIDLSKAPGSRIVNLTMNGKPVADNQELVLALNNYRVGTLQGLGLLPKDGSSLVYDSVQTPTPEMQRLIQKYIVEEKGGVISPNVDNNWKLLNAPKDSREKESSKYLVNNDYITIPKSADGRTANVKSINALEKLPANTAEIELLNSTKLKADEKAKIEKLISSGKVTNYGQLYNSAVEIIETGVTTVTPTVPVITTKPSQPTTVTPTVPVVTKPQQPMVDPMKIQYTVVKGDTLSSIGRKYGVTWQQLAKMNNLKNPDLIYPGDVIVIYK